MLFCGIDVGKRCSAAVLGENLVYVGELEEAMKFKFVAAGIDAPLTFSTKLRDCDRELLKMGIKLFPPGWRGMQVITKKGMTIAEELRRSGIEVYEVYPYATRKILSIAPNAKKSTAEGRRDIIRDINRFISLPEEIELNHHELDAIIAALTVKFFKEGRGRVVGKECSIVIPI